MNSTATSHIRPRRLPVQWLDAPAFGPLLIRGAHAPSRVAFGAPPKAPVGTPRCDVRSAQRAAPTLKVRVLRAFTLLELMMVIAIIGFLAVVTLPHVRGFGQANSMTSATRQLLDDVALARQRAMVNRSTVYMVFLPPVFWTNYPYSDLLSDNGIPSNKQEANLLKHQYAAYALITLGSVGDQPGRHYPRYVTDWRVLPDGVFIAPFEFGLTNSSIGYTNIFTTNTLSGTINTSQIFGWSLVNVPFPSIFPPSTNMSLPCIAFSPQGGLATQFTNQYIVLARGSIFYPTDTNGAPVFEAPNLVETPPGNDVNNPNLIRIDWMTARATLMQNQLQ
jgi:prepilin-type N-terminal cleavage/methylation domain-containing protein